MIATSVSIPAKKRKWRGWWLRQLHTWHWMSAAISLVGMLMFALTGITLNHAATISAKPVIDARAGMLSPDVLHLIVRPVPADDPLPPRVAAAVERAVGIDPSGRAGEWSDSEVYVALPRPGGDGWVSIDRSTGAITSELTTRGWISYLNDLHKGRNAGGAWRWFLDIFAGACVIFTLTGLLLLQMHARHRPSTWPIVTVGVVIPAALAIWFIH